MKTMKAFLNPLGGEPCRLKVYLEGWCMQDCKRATDIDEQIKILKLRGMIIDDEQKAKECLLDIGYYRLGFYWFPFKKTYPRKGYRDHKLKSGTRMEYAIKLYYFDFDIRNLFLRYISRIEINFRTKVIYVASNHFLNDPFWYTKEENFKDGFVGSSNYKHILTSLTKESAIAHDLKKYKRAYSPAWKAIEHMTFGAVICLYENLKDPVLRNAIAKEFGINSAKYLSHYINIVRQLRNYCAHGKVLFDISFPKAICDSKELKLGARKTMLSGGYMVLRYMLGKISTPRERELSCSMRKIFSKISSQEVLDVIENCSGLKQTQV